MSEIWLQSRNQWPFLRRYGKTWKKWRPGGKHTQVARHCQMVCSEADGGKKLGDAMIDLSLGATGRGRGLYAQADFIAQIG